MNIIIQLFVLLTVRGLSYSNNGDTKIKNPDHCDKGSQ